MQQLYWFVVVTKFEFDRGNDKLANGLLQRLQFPLTLGGIKKSLEVGKEYLVRLLIP